jgi:phage regulator Rha-like protein
MTQDLIPHQAIQSKILVLRDKKVMLDRDLAMLYEVESKVLNQAVKRNIHRFPDDFMFQLNKREADSLRSQFVTLKKGQHSKYLPYAFTEHGILMLSSVLNSERAVQVNIQIVRIFVKLREMIATYQENSYAIKEMKRDNDHRFKVSSQLFESIFKDIKTIYKLLEPPCENPKNEIGFKAK